MRSSFFAVLLVAMWVLGCSGCVSAEQMTANAAQSVNAIARTADNLDRVTVLQCTAEENRLVDAIDDAELAAKAVARVRSACDSVYFAIDAVDSAIAAADRTFLLLETREASPEALAAAVIKARQAFKDAEAAHKALRETLSK